MPTAPWYVEAFTEAYLDVYAHRDAAGGEREARGTLNLLRYTGAQGRMLDLCSGAGRHARAFRLLRCPVTCLDLSPQLVLKSAALGLPTVRADMRALACLFSSFGYFETDEQHLAVLQEVARVLRPGAAALFDLMDPQTVRYKLKVQDVEQANGRIVEVERALVDGGRRVEKQIRVYRDGSATQSWHESVRLFTLDEFEALAVRARLRFEGAWGDYDGRPHLPGETRQIVVLRRPVAS
jgi:SAM-dependent methyltransferase